MIPHERKATGRTLIPLLVAVGGIVLGVGGVALLRPLSDGSPPIDVRAAGHETRASARPLSDAAIRARVEPSVVDVTATLTYDDETASGTGFMIDARAGLVLTNNHVIRDSTSVTVTAPGTGQIYPASVVGVDVAADVAILRIGPSAGLPAAPLGDSSGAAVGSPVLSFGNQAGAGGSPTVSSGAITGTGRTIQADDGAAGFSETLHGMLATSARIEPGDSGGPLANSAGSVIGVDTAAGTGGAQTGYAIPIDAAVAAERQIVARRPGPGISLGVQGFLGVVVGTGTTTSPLAQREQASDRGSANSSDARAAGCASTRQDVTTPASVAPAAEGALVIGVLCDTGAATAGIMPGDVITAADGHQVQSPNALTTVVSGCQPGAVVPVTWVSEAGRSHTAWIKLEAAPVP